MAQNANAVAASQAAEIAQGAENNSNVAAADQLASTVQGVLNA